MKTYRVDYANLGSYSIADSGAFGKAFEAALTGKRCKVSGKVDRWLGHTRLEVKTAGGQLWLDGEETIAHADKVLYCPVPIADADGYVDPYKQEAFLLNKEAFLEALEQAGAIRTDKIRTPEARAKKAAENGERGPVQPGEFKRSVAIQTFWNRKANKPHGRLLYRILDAMYENCECTLEELLEG